ncbi:putative formate transporter [Paratrimastix pyriformis]|uniref:Formate transporter n=1 Tax=Paratrimastix pyriformis TaxID=342808 RepID=A0ABQ8UFT4_9EUKA|nr:putative formate transporter [Paratrimastix pyriformis]
MGFAGPAAIYQSACTAARRKAALPWYKILISGFMAGVYIAVGGTVATRTAGDLLGFSSPTSIYPLPGLQRFIFGGLFPVGLMLVIFHGAELWTGNTMMCIFHLLNFDRKKEKFSSVVLGWCKNWFWCYIGNFCGSVAFAFFCCYLTGLYDADPVKSYVMTIAYNKSTTAFYKLFFRAIGCNWLVCLAVLGALAADDIGSKIGAIWFPIQTFATIGYEHSIANMFFCPLGLMLGANTTFWMWLGNNLVSVTLGNLVGAMLFVGLTYPFLHGTWSFQSAAPVAASPSAEKDKEHAAGETKAAPSPAPATSDLHEDPHEDHAPITPNPLISQPASPAPALATSAAPSASTTSAPSLVSAPSL